MFKLKTMTLIIVSALVGYGFAYRDQLVLTSNLISINDRVKPVTLYADESGHFFGNLTINGQSLKYIVDTGASHVTMNVADAERAHIDYAEGAQTSLLTPNGDVQAFSVEVSSLVIGQAVLEDVTVMVIDGDFPPYVLLGFSVQKLLDIKRDNDVMTLGPKS